MRQQAFKDDFASDVPIVSCSSFSAKRADAQDVSCLVVSFASLEHNNENISFLGIFEAR